MHSIQYDLSASECQQCRKSVLVPVGEGQPHCYFCGRGVAPPDPARYSNVNATIQRLVSFARDSRVFDKNNTNSAIARFAIEDLGKYVIDFLTMNEASIRYGYYGKPGEYDEKMLARTRAFLDAMEKSYREAQAEQQAAAKQ